MKNTHIAVRVPVNKIHSHIIQSAGGQQAKNWIDGRTVITYRLLRKLIYGSGLSEQTIVRALYGGTATSDARISALYGGRTTLRSVAKVTNVTPCNTLRYLSGRSLDASQTRRLDQRIGCLRTTVRLNAAPAESHVSVSRKSLYTAVVAVALLAAITTLTVLRFTPISH